MQRLLDNRIDVELNVKYHTKDEDCDSEGSEGDKKSVTFIGYL